mgnify:FL=1
MSMRQGYTPIALKFGLRQTIIKKNSSTGDRRMNMEAQVDNVVAELVNGLVRENASTAQS